MVKKGQNPINVVEECPLALKLLTYVMVYVVHFDIAFEVWTDLVMAFKIFEFFLIFFFNFSPIYCIEELWLPLFSVHLVIRDVV